MRNYRERSDPPFEKEYEKLFRNHNNNTSLTTTSAQTPTQVKERELPLIDLAQLGPGAGEKERERCKEQIAASSKEWGFFQVENHGIPTHILEEMTKEQVKVFRQPFEEKKKDNCMNISLSHGSYRWGAPNATSLTQLSWSEAFHIPLTDISRSSGPTHNNLCSTVKQFATTVSQLASTLAKILVEKLSDDDDNDEGVSFFEDKCLPNTCYLRMNRYPACPNYSHVLGLMSHTDSDFLTILYQDQVGGLQLIKDGTWISVKPNPNALIVNIGDLFQAWSNDVYKSVVHRVVANPKKERFSTAYFLCPSGDAIIRSYKEPSIYREFTFEEYREQVKEDVEKCGHKIGLPRFKIDYETDII